MRFLTKSENWSLIVLFASLALAFMLSFAPVYRHLFWGVMVVMAAAVIVETGVLFTMSRRRSN